MDEAQEIRREMAELRTELYDDVRGVSQSLKAMMDWKFYVRHYPGLVMSLAAGLGFAFLPGKKRKTEAAPPVKVEAAFSGPDWESWQNRLLALASGGGGLSGLLTRKIAGIAIGKVMQTVSSFVESMLQSRRAEKQVEGKPPATKKRQAAR